MKCSQLFHSIRQGFSEVKKDRIEEWSGLKTQGFWLGWFKVNASWPIIFSLVYVGFAAFKGEPTMIRAAGLDSSVRLHFCEWPMLDQK